MLILRRSIELLVGVAALLLPGGLLLVILLWLYRYAHAGNRKTVVD
jgi:hypothetical protein